MGYWERRYWAIWRALSRLPLGWRWGLLAALAGFAVVSALTMPRTSPAPVRVPAGDLVGFASVIDGDTLDIHGQRVRLYAVDAPESQQLCEQNGKKTRCGQLAAFALADFLQQKTVSCTRHDTDRYGRMVAVCFAGNVEINGWLIENGHALAYRQYGGNVYNKQEAAARAARRGIWAGTFLEPWTWRANKRAGIQNDIPAVNTAPPLTTSRGMFTSCKEARAAGKTPLLRGEPGYNPNLDGDKDGKACE